MTPEEATRKLVELGYKPKPKAKEKASYGKNALNVLGEVGEDISKLGKGISSGYKSLSNTPVNPAFEHPGQAASGIFPALGSIADIFPAAYNALEYPVNKLSKIAFNNPDLEPDYAELRGGKLGSDLADLVAGKPKNEKEQSARNIGEAGWSFGNPEGLLSKAAGITGAKKLAGGVNDAIPSLPGNSAQQNLIQNIGKDADIALKNQKEAQNLGLNLRPAEASGNPIQAAYEGSLGTSKEGAQKLHEFSKDQIIQQRRVINELLDDVNPNAELVYDQARTLSQNIIEGKKEALREKARPYYEKSGSLELDDRTFSKIINDDPKIRKVLDEVYSDPDYAAGLKGVAPNSIRALDEVKKRIDDDIKVAQRKGENGRAKLLIASKNKLTNELDKISPDYKKARSIYSEDLPAIKTIEDSAIGKIANMNDEQLKNVSKTIFDPSVKDSKRIDMYRKEIIKEAPEIWYGLVRNDMEARISKGKVTGSKFYKNILEDENLYRHYQTALKNNPEALKKLHSVKSIFANLLPEKTAKTAAGQAKASLDVPRSSLQAAQKVLDNLFGGQYDNAAIDLITGNKWNKEFNQISNVKDSKLKVSMLTGLLDTINKEKQTPEQKQYSPEEADKMLRQMGYKPKDEQLNPTETETKIKAPTIEEESLINGDMGIKY